MKFATKLYDIAHLTLSMLLNYLGKLKNLIFCKIAFKTTWSFRTGLGVSSCIAYLFVMSSTFILFCS